MSWIEIKIEDRLLYYFKKPDIGGGHYYMLNTLPRFYGYAGLLTEDETYYMPEDEEKEEWIGNQ